MFHYSLSYKDLEIIAIFGFYCPTENLKQSKKLVLGIEQARNGVHRSQAVWLKTNSVFAVPYYNLLFAALPLW